MTSPALNTPCRSAERAALDKAVKALRAGVCKLHAAGHGYDSRRGCVFCAVHGLLDETLTQIATLVPDAVHGDGAR